MIRSLIRQSRFSQALHVSGKIFRSAKRHNILETGDAQSGRYGACVPQPSALLRAAPRTHDLPRTSGQQGGNLGARVTLFQPMKMPRHSGRRGSERPPFRFALRTGADRVGSVALPASGAQLPLPALEMDSIQPLRCHAAARFGSSASARSISAMPASRCPSIWASA